LAGVATFFRGQADFRRAVPFRSHIGFGRKFREIYDISERAVARFSLERLHRDGDGGSVLSGLRRQAREGAALPTKAPFSQRFEEAVGLACEMASARQAARPVSVAGQHGASLVYWRTHRFHEAEEKRRALIE
jgi:hypothetical protein